MLEVYSSHAVCLHSHVEAVVGSSIERLGDCFVDVVFDEVAEVGVC